MNDPSGESRRALVGQLRRQQEESWRAGRQLKVEDILEGVDALLNEEDILELVYGEICLREQHKSPADVEGFVQRFPQLGERIVRLFEMHEVLERQESRGNSTWGESQDRTQLFDQDALSQTASEPASAADSEFTPPDIPGYELLEELGRGGMGRVFKANQEGTEQIVALKMVRGDWLNQLDDDLRRQAINQFGLEVRATAQLKHPNIVDVLHMGQVAGQPFYAMELVTGDSLSDLVADGPLGNREAARYVAQVADAIQQAHQRGILHRDIKPQNVLVERPSGVAKLADFGLAQLADGDKAKEGDHSVAGTLAYMAPEQFRDPLPTTSNDIYSLGATLYHLIAGQPPFLADSISEARRQIEVEEPAPPSQLNPNASSELEQICLKTLAKSPHNRHATAGELADELGEYLARPQRAGDMANVSGQMLLSGFVILLLNVGVWWLLPANGAVGIAREITIWVLIAAMYPVAFRLLLKLPGTSGKSERETRSILWTLFAGKMFAAACVCVILRSTLPDVRTAIIASYPAFAALSGLVTFTMGANFWSRFYWTAFSFWALSLLMVVQLPSRWIPLEYGVALSVGVTAFAVYVRRLAREYQ